MVEQVSYFTAIKFSLRVMYNLEQIRNIKIDLDLKAVNIIVTSKEIYNVYCDV